MLVVARNQKKLKDVIAMSSSLTRTFASKPPHNEPSLSTGKKNKKSVSNRNSTPQREQRSRKSNRFKSTRTKEWKSAKSLHNTEASQLLKPSNFLYNDLRRRSLIEGDGENNTPTETPRMPLLSLDASSLLDPLSYCKTSAKDIRHGVSRSISGTDAARRLLRGKKDFLDTARKLKAPVVLEGHGVPQQLLQNCIDMADALMMACGEEIVEITFHNYNYNEKKLPQVLRIRSRDATNKAMSWPPESHGSGVDWEYHMSLYLAVMERLSNTLGLVLQKNLAPPFSSEEENKDEIMSSPLLFPQSSTPHWNVDILRGSYFELHQSTHSMKDVPLFPIVEFSQMRDSEVQQNGHILIRLQGTAGPNLEFSGIQNSRQPVSLVFDACFRNE